MNEELKKLHLKQNELVEAQRTLFDKAEAEKREFSAEEQAEYDKRDADVDALEGEIDGLRKRMERETKLKEREERLKESVSKRIIDDVNTGAAVVSGVVDERTAERQMAGFEFCLRNRPDLASEIPEFRALQADADVAGGYTVAPVQFVSNLIKAVDDLVFMRQLSTVLTVTKAESLGVVSLDNDPADPDWTAEIGTTAEDSTMSFGNRELTPHKLSKLLKVSNKLLRISTQNISSLVVSRLAYKFSVVEENVYMNGNAAGQPLGIFVASDKGISTARDVSSQNTTTSITGDGLINVKYSLKSQYMDLAVWMFHRDALKQIRKLKDGNQNYIWMRGIASDRPSTILENRYFMSEFVPNTFTASQYVGILGDMRNYWIADAMSMELQVLKELYAVNDQTGYIGRKWTDGMPVLEEAFARVQLAA